MKLNPAQQKAVDHIYGPLLVLAGPGTGKTQLLSARIANILQKTDANAQNILCLTFTESASQNMRERLASLIRDDAYDVHINTYHGFGSDIIRSYPEYFEEIDLETGKDSRLERPIDDLQALQIVSALIDSLPYDSPLFGARHYPKHIVSTISELKRGLIDPLQLAKTAQENLKHVYALSPQIASIFKDVKRMPSKASQAIPLFEQVLNLLTSDDSLVLEARAELEKALQEAENSDSSKPLTAWKNDWLTKDDKDCFVFTEEAQHLRMSELAKLYDRYQKTLEEKGLYDFDDMILRTIHALKVKDDLRFTLQERYQFILLDEFQDTNTAQFELVKLLADNPVNEGMPNIFAVGDDDQAIYAFQGARVSNMLQFIESFRSVAVINLTENYRSHPHILHVAHQIATQIEDRLHHSIEGIDKVLTASNVNLPNEAQIERHEFAGEANEYAWVAEKVRTLIEMGVNPSEIAVLAPQHKYLERIVPCFVKESVPVTYEKREDILQTPLLLAFRRISELLEAISTQQNARMDELFPQILSLDFFQIPIEHIWKVNWKCNDERASSWTECALDNEVLAPHIKALLKLGMLSTTEPLEYVLDYITGSTSLKLDADSSYTSPLKNFYFEQQTDSLEYYEMLTNLSVIREHLRQLQAGNEQLLTIKDFLSFLHAHEQAEQPLINTHPIAQSKDSVQLMTTYKAKGLEFEHVFLLSLHDDIWGKKARGNSNKLSLPANLQHIRYRGSNEDELRRLLFVAITRAKVGLYLTSHAQKDNGKSTEPVKYLQEFMDEDETRRSAILPEGYNTVNELVMSADATMQAVETLWYARHLHLTAKLRDLLADRLAKYMMSPTHLNTFIDTEFGGPSVFLLQTLLRFPQAPGEDGEFGNAIHATLDWAQRASDRQTESKLLSQFDIQLDKRYISRDRRDDFRRRGHQALTTYLKERPLLFSQHAKSEVDFRQEGVLLGEARLSGKIDRIEIDEDTKTIHIVDFKTGKPAMKWDTSMKLQKYKQQLYFYKLLIEGSHSWAGYKVGSARLEFVEPLANGTIAPPLYVDFTDKDLAEIRTLITETWRKIMLLDL
jgi:DNA helicase-2/ATP-dependent DNA helicase PcrA